MHKTISDKIVELNNKQTLAAKQLDIISKLLEIYPDLEIYKTRHKAVYTSNSAIPTDCEISHTCGCCSDAGVTVWSYVDVNGLDKVYFKPKIEVGEIHWAGGDRPYKDWRERLTKNNIPQDIIEKVADHFRKDREERLRDAQSSEDVEI